MIRYSYLTQMDPPAPFVNVVLRHPVSGVELRDQPAQIDSAADRTVLPESLVKSLVLPQVGTIHVGGFGGATFILPIYGVLLGLHNLAALQITVASHAQEPWILLGRDVLNAYRLLLDGPQLALEIG